jgi:hypothetical protein
VGGLGGDHLGGLGGDHVARMGREHFARRGFYDYGDVCPYYTQYTPPYTCTY